MSKEMLSSICNISYKEKATVWIISVIKKCYRCLLLPLVCRRLREVMIAVYKILNEIYEKEVPPCFTTSSCETKMLSRDHNIDQLNERSHLKIRSSWFTHRVVTTWNSLPIDDVNASNANTFKSPIDRFWKNQDIVYDCKANCSTVADQTWKYSRSLSYSGHRTPIGSWDNIYIRWHKVR